MSNPNTLRLLIVAGEASGDAHAAALGRALREAAPETEFEFFGSTGAQMREAGIESIVKADELSILGCGKSAARCQNSGTLSLNSNAPPRKNNPTPQCSSIGRTSICAWRAGSDAAASRSSITSVRNCGPGGPIALAASSATLI
jgi:hypothetical protein